MCQYSDELEKAFAESFYVETRRTNKKGKLVVRERSCVSIMQEIEQQETIHRANLRLRAEREIEMVHAYEECAPKEVSPFGDTIVISDGVFRLIRKILHPNE